MSNPDEERQKHLEEMDRGMKEDPLAYMGLPQPMPWPEFVKLLGGPEWIARNRRENEREELRKKIFFIAACALPVILIGLVVAAFVFGRF